MNIFYFLLSYPFLGILIISKGTVWIPVFILAVIIRLFLWPLYSKATLSQKKLQMIQPKITEIQKQYLQDPLKANSELKKLFQENKINPSFTFIFLIIQIFLVIIFWNFFLLVIKDQWYQYLIPYFQNFYLNFIKKYPLNFSFFKIDLKSPHFFLTLILAFFNFFFIIYQTFRQNRLKNDKTKSFNQYSSAFLSFLILLFYNKIPALLIIYWLGFSLGGIIQEIFEQRKDFKKNFSKNEKVNIIK